MEIDLTSEEVKSIILHSSEFKTVVADKIISDFMDINSDEIKREYLAFLSDEVRKIIKEYVHEYYSGQSISNQIRDAIKSLTKNEVIDILKEKL